MSPMITDDTLCDLGLFHSAEPVHKHPHCANCFATKRCSGPGSDLKLITCKKCKVPRYCSKKCQAEAWPGMHVTTCTENKVWFAALMTESGNRMAGHHHRVFAEFHYSTIANATLAALLQAKDAIPDVANEYFVAFNFRYRNDPTLPGNQQFELRSLTLEPKEKALADPVGYGLVWVYRIPAKEKFSADLGSKLACIASCLLRYECVSDRDSRVRPYETVSSLQFGFEHRHWNATPCSRDPFYVFMDTVDQGKNMQLCCGKFEELVGTQGEEKV